MAEKVDSKASYFLVGLSIGSAIGILFAPKSGKQTREYMAQKVKEGSEYTQKKARELRERTEDLIDRGNELAIQKKKQITKAIEAGRETYERQKSRAHIA